MTFNFNSPTRFNNLVNGLALAALMATGVSAIAQVTAPASSGSGPRSEHMGKHDPTKMQAMMEKHQADLKAKLKLTPAQESAWTAYTTVMQPPAGMGMRLTDTQRADIDKLTTPERIDKMRAMRTESMTQMNADMDKRGNATKTFYAALTPEQQKVFDAEHHKRGVRGEHKHGGLHTRKADMPRH